jgi:hypothetical protein
MAGSDSGSCTRPNRIILQVVAGLVVVVIGQGSCNHSVVAVAGMEKRQSGIVLFAREAGPVDTLIAEVVIELALG